ncbi:MAG TPA: Sb-PDE family phosphodiesterase [bacterium]|nr:Sb-PDE family phosphodiesterase [bacterium]HPN43767.1 Sb-PDE family phosphodiesterase [bacterium]
MSRKIVCRLFVVVAALAVVFTDQSALALSRSEIRIPDLPGYTTLKCDFHLHTVFSDGNVWPTIRVEEAWADGLDVIAITDHVEYRPHKDDINVSLNRPHEIAASLANELGIILLRGAEITRSMPPGHFNAIVLEDCDKLNVAEWRDALQNAAEQKAFITWNHPGWLQPNIIPIWYDEHTEIFNKGYMMGIEIVNDHEYYPLAFTWAIEKNITILGCSDSHSPLMFDFDNSPANRRPMTLVFAKEKSAPAVKEALLAGRTAVYAYGKLYGKEEYLRSIFTQTVEIVNPEISITGKGRGFVRLVNHSDIPFQLSADGQADQFTVPGNLTIGAGETVMLPITNKGMLQGKNPLRIPFKVDNLLTAPEAPLSVEFNIVVDFINK